MIYANGLVFALINDFLIRSCNIIWLGLLHLQHSSAGGQHSGAFRDEQSATDPGKKLVHQMK